MSVFDTLADVRPGPWTILRWLLLVAGISVFAGAFIFHVLFGIRSVTGQWSDLLANVRYAFVYTSVMAGSLRATTAVMKIQVPLHSRWAVALHVGVLSVGAVLSYALATLICWMINPAGFSLHWRVLVVSGTLAFFITLGWSTLVYIKAFYQQLRKAEAAQYEARLAALRAQINPHFLFNAFNSIAALVRTRPEEAEAVVEDLSDLFRYALQASKDGGMATLGKEIEAARRYLRVEKARYRDRLIAEIGVPEALESVPVPSMTLQPLVENAVKHGAGGTRGECTVSVTAEQADGALLLRVLDTGPGFDTLDLDEVIEEGSGLANVRERLELFFGEEAEMRLQPQGIELRMPLRENGQRRPRTSLERAVAR